MEHLRRMLVLRPVSLDCRKLQKKSSGRFGNCQRNFACSKRCGLYGRIRRRHAHLLLFATDNAADVLHAGHRSGGSSPAWECKASIASLVLSRDIGYPDRAISCEIKYRPSLPVGYFAGADGRILFLGATTRMVKIVVVVGRYAQLFFVSDTSTAAYADRFFLPVPRHWCGRVGRTGAPGAVDSSNVMEAGRSTWHSYWPAPALVVR